MSRGKVTAIIINVKVSTTFYKNEKGVLIDSSPLPCLIKSYNFLSRKWKGNSLLFINRTVALENDEVFFNATRIS